MRAQPEPLRLVVLAVALAIVIATPYLAFHSALFSHSPLSALIKNSLEGLD